MHKSIARELMTPLAGLKPQNINNTAVNGETIVSPWRIARRAVVAAICGAMTTNDVITIKAQLRRLGTSTWDDALNKAGTTLKFTDQSNANSDGTTKGGQFKANFCAFGEIDFSQLKTTIADGAAYEYDAMRVVMVNAAAQNVLAGAVVILTDLYAHPAASHTLEQTFDSQRYASGSPS